MGTHRYIFDEKTATYIPLKKNKKKYLYFIPVAILVIAGGILIGMYIPKDKTAVAVRSEKDLMVVKNQYQRLQSELNEIEGALSKVQEKDQNIYRTFFQMDTLSEDERKAGMGGSERYAQFKDYELGDIIVNISEKADQLKKQLEIQENSLESIRKNASSKSKEFLHIPAIQPIENKDLTRLASGYGMRRHPILGVSRMHEGLDFTAPRGTPIYATANGVVETAGVHNGYGNTVILNHGNGYESLYAHMSKFNVRAGQSVARGQIIGYVGTTGLSTGPHLHYEIKKDGVKINPISYFYSDVSPGDYNKLKEAAELSETSWD